MKMHEIEKLNKKSRIRHKKKYEDLNDPDLIFNAVKRILSKKEKYKDCKFIKVNINGCCCIIKEKK